MNGLEFVKKAEGLRGQSNRIAKLQAYCSNLNLDLEDVEIVVNRDRKWNQRSNRQLNERLAVCIGYTNDKYKGFPVEIYWAYPKTFKMFLLRELRLRNSNNYREIALITKDESEFGYNVSVTGLEDETFMTTPQMMSTLERLLERGFYMIDNQMMFGRGRTWLGL